jgi:biopolymer transport protein ExbB
LRRASGAFAQSYPQILCTNAGLLLTASARPSSAADAAGHARGLRHNPGHRTGAAPESRLHAWSPDLFSIIQAAGWPIWPLIACSVIGLALIIERFISLKTDKILPPQLLDEAIMVSRNGIPGPEVVKQLEQNSAFGEVLASGFRALVSNPRASEDDVRSNLEGAGRIAAAKLQRYLGAIATIASAAPLLGLLGTVIGMIEIFGSQGGDGGMGTVPGAGDPTRLAHGISIALYNTAFGLIVAIPALIFWRYFRARVDAYLLSMEVAAERFARHLVTLRK